MAAGATGETLAKRCLGLLRRRWGAFLLLTGILLVTAVAVALPYAYAASVDAIFARQMDQLHGADGWVITSFGADLQYGEHIHLYRTLYVRFVYPRGQRFTPWTGKQFTHKTTCPTRPSHYWIHVTTRTRGIAYFWSMRSQRWEVQCDNEIRHEPHERIAAAARALANRERHGCLWYSPDLLEKLKQPRRR